MRSLREHPFFQVIDEASKIEKLTGRWGAGTASKNSFFRCVHQAHPFIFDRRTTIEKRLAGRAMDGFKDLIEDFSMPFGTSLYLMTDAPHIQAPMNEGSKETCQYELCGYLINETKPAEYFMAYEVSWVKYNGLEQRVPSINQYNIDLVTIEKVLRMAEAVDARIFDKKTEAHVLKETAVIFNLTNCISVKRIGVEVSPQFNIKSRGIDAGFKSIKYDNIIHIADKVEYEYTKPLENQNIDWEYRGFWRGHWRALYYPDTLTDSFGRRIVDYTRIGKNRAEVYEVPGYTWVVEHFRGEDERLAEMKTRTVKHG